MINPAQKVVTAYETLISDDEDILSQIPNQQRLTMNVSFHIS